MFNNEKLARELHQKYRASFHEMQRTRYNEWDCIGNIRRTQYRHLASFITRFCVVRPEIDPSSYSLKLDGDQWCALLGSDLQNGISGFGVSRDSAIDTFSVNLIAALAQAERGAA